MVRALRLPGAVLVVALCICGLILSTIHADDLQTRITITICGDGIVQAPPEVCDEGPSGNLGTYSSTTSARVCGVTCESFGPYCGDDILQVRFGEGCDDGNNTSGDLCSATCTPEIAVNPGGGGSPTVGSIPSIPDGTRGEILSQTETKVVLRGKAYPNADVNVLRDGKKIGTTRSDSNANFLFTTTDITPGTATFGFTARDRNGTESITTSVVFEIVQSAVTTVANIFFPPTIKVSESQISADGLFAISGQTIPAATVITDISDVKKTSLRAESEPTGLWSLQIDAKSLAKGGHIAKSYFEQGETLRSGYGRSISFFIGDGSALGTATPDLNKDEKVNLVDFSIFLLRWGSDDAEADFNLDGAVNLADFSIMLFNWTG